MLHFCLHFTSIRCNYNYNHNYTYKLQSQVLQLQLLQLQLQLQLTITITITITITELSPHSIDGHQCELSERYLTSCTMPAWLTVGP